VPTILGCYAKYVILSYAKYIIYVFLFLGMLQSLLRGAHIPWINGFPPSRQGTTLLPSPSSLYPSMSMTTKKRSLMGMGGTQKIKALVLYVQLFHFRDLSLQDHPAFSEQGCNEQSQAA
jgi:hypothetical protein